MNNHQNRRSFIGTLATVTAGTVIANRTAFASGEQAASFPNFITPASQKYTVCAFSKLFDEFGEDMFALLADAGFEGVDLTVRRNGYISPENVEKDLPRAVNAAQKKGLSVPMIATDITDASDSTAKRVLKTASETGVKYYRLGGFKYDPGREIEQNLDIFRKRLSDLSALSAEHNIKGCYQNHVGGGFGGAVWDLWTALRGLDARHIGSQYDIRHATVDGFTCWQPALKVIAPYVGCFCMKDFVFANNNGKWITKTVPMGAGAVDFDAFFGILRDNNIQGPMSIHFEFPIAGKSDTSLPKTERMKMMLPAVKKEADTLKMMIAGK